MDCSFLYQLLVENQKIFIIVGDLLFFLREGFVRNISFLIGSFLIATSSLFCDCAERICVGLNQVVFNQSGIWVETGGNFFEVEGILFDKEDNTFYAYKKDPKWQCGNCRKFNDPKRDNCWYCGWPWGPPGPND